MSLLRIFIYWIGGALLTLLWIASSFTSLSSSVQREISVAEMLLVPAGGWLILLGADRRIHATFFGIRNVLRLKDYRPCPVCPITGGRAVVSRNLVFSAHALGPVHVTITHRLPILISKEAEARFPKQDIVKISGMTITRYTPKKFTIYIKDRNYQLVFAATNRAALEHRTDGDDRRAD